MALSPLPQSAATRSDGQLAPEWRRYLTESDGKVRNSRLDVYTVAALPSASTAGQGALVYVSDASGGPTIAVSNGSAWKVVAVLGATVS